MKRMFVFLIACFLCFSTVTISYAFRFAGLHTLFCFSGADRVADPFDSEVGLMLEKVAIGVSWLPEGLATAIYALAALLLVFLFIKIVLLIIKCISDLVLFWKK